MEFLGDFQGEHHHRCDYFSKPSGPINLRCFYNFDALGLSLMVFEGVVFFRSFGGFGLVFLGGFRGFGFLFRVFGVFGGFSR